METRLKSNSKHESTKTRKHEKELFLERLDFRTWNPHPRLTCLANPSCRQPDDFDVYRRAQAEIPQVSLGPRREPFSFGGWNESKFGVGDITGRGSIEFWTKSKKTTTKWNREAGANWMS